MTAPTPPYKPSDSLKIGAGYKSPPRRRCVHQSRHHNCHEDLLHSSHGV